MAIKKHKRNSLYGYPAPTSFAFPAPVVANRAPTSADYGELGQEWIFTPSGALYVLTVIALGRYTWSLITTGGGSGSFANLVVSGTSTLTGAVTMGSTLQVSGNINSATGNIVASTGSITAAIDITAETGDIIATAGDIVATAGIVEGESMLATAAAVAGGAGTIVYGGTVTTGTFGTPTDFIVVYVNGALAYIPYQSVI